jgi:hypothetical protein
MSEKLYLSQTTLTQIGSDYADLQRLYSEGWAVEEMRGGVLAEWEDAGVFVARELGPRPWTWMAWLGTSREEMICATGETLAGVLAVLAEEIGARSRAVAAFAKGR